ncbi:hypothetical protein LCGC14_1392120 [marine sediment metagenome]|uniref:Uncharacterized protein n=1 Tax=marine sediment metagenome TaxID=412755 RepID=A0A0F9N179_9ZZZZ
MTKYEQQYRKLCHQCQNMQEDNACSVIALAVVAGCDFVAAYVSMANHGRKPGKGTTMMQLLNALERDFGIEMECMDIRGEDSAKAALDKHVSRSDIGIVEVRQHVIVYKEGQAIDNKANLAREPLFLFRIVTPKETDK